MMPLPTPSNRPVPFSLGVRVANTGAGPAEQVHIESAEPRIVENEQGLLIGFDIIGAQVNDQAVEPSLTVHFGHIPARRSAVARWQMESSLSRRFCGFRSELYACG